MTALGRMVALGAAVIVSVAAPSAASAQRAADRVRVVDAGPGPSGRLLRDALAGRHVTRFADSGAVDLPRDSAIGLTLVVVGGDARLASRVQGDVIVVGGDLFLRPGAEITGRAVAIGGCVYRSSLATAHGGQLCFRDNTFTVDRTADGETRLAYRSLRVAPASGLRLAGIRGFELPTYDRVNGVSLAWGPTLAVDAGRFEFDPRVTYRSDLGELDPSLVGRWRLGRRSAAILAGGRGTFTNDAWIRSHLINAIGAFVAGSDVRNYYRADRAEARLTRVFESESGATELHVGALTEDAWSVGPDSGATGGPYSLFNRRDPVEGMLRPNPRGTEGRVSSAVAGAERSFTQGDLTGRAALAVELPFDAPASARFVQTTFDGETSFATFGTQRITAGIHGVLTTGDSTPRQRYTYLGGSGTLPTELLLGMGGDRLLYVDALYSVPIDQLNLPFIGSPVLALRYAAGSAGIRELPRFTQNVGVRVALAMVRVDFMVNPATRDTDLGLGIAVRR